MTERIANERALTDIERLRQEIKLDNRRFSLQIAATIAGAIVAGAAGITVLATALHWWR